MEADSLGWRFLELSVDNSRNGNLTRRVVDPVDAIRSFVSWQLEGQLFNCAVTVPRPRKRSRKLTDDPRFPAVCLGPDEARERRAFLERQSLKGFQLLLMTDSRVDDCRQFFERLGYEVTSEGTGSSRSLPQELVPVWRPDTLGPALAVGVRMGSCVACAFGHDADPVYLFLAE